MLNVHLTHQMNTRTHSSIETAITVCRHAADGIELPAALPRSEYGRSAAGLALCVANTEEKPRVPDDHRADAGARHRSESRDLHHREHRAAAAAPLPRS